MKFMEDKRSAVDSSNRQLKHIQCDAKRKLEQPQPTTIESNAVFHSNQASLPSCLHSRFCGENKQPSYLNDPFLQVLLSQLEKTNASIRIHDAFQAHAADVEEKFKREFTVNIANCLVHNRDQKDDQTKRTLDPNANTLSDWMICYDDEVGAEYYYNKKTGEASWVDPRQAA